MLETTPKIRTAVVAGVIAIGITGGAILYNGPVPVMRVQAVMEPVKSVPAADTPKLSFVNSSYVTVENNHIDDATKASFIKFMVPMIEDIQADIMKDRATVLNLLQKRNPTTEDKQILRDKMDEYDIENGDVQELLKRMDVVPSSMIIGQAAIESGWGKSSISHKTNGLFGQKGANTCGLAANDGGKYTCFKSYKESILSYVRNLNTNPVYGEFRDIRYRMRTQGGKLDYNVLVTGLGRYSTKKDEYIHDVRELITNNKLYTFDFS